MQSCLAVHTQKISDNPDMNTTINADAAELAKFSDLAHRWWDADGEFRPLHQINPCAWPGSMACALWRGSKRLMWGVAAAF
jgi:hypothetical protein